MTTHCSPSPGATTQQLVCQGPAGNPTTSTDVNSRAKGRFQELPLDLVRRDYRGTKRRRERESLLLHLRRPPDARGAANDTEGTWPRAAAANASLPVAVTNDGECARWSVAPSSAVATRSSARPSARSSSSSASSCSP